MAKRLIGILLLLVAMPAFTSEVKILCTATSNGEKFQKVVTFDPEAKIVVDYSEGYSNKNSDRTDRRGFYREEELYLREDLREAGGRLESWTINRNDGSLKIVVMPDRLVIHGSCSPYKKTF